MADRYSITFIRGRERASHQGVDGVVSRIFAIGPGVLGSPKPNQVLLFALERVGVKTLPPGEYNLVHAFMRNKTGKRIRAIRVLGAFSRGRIYFHAANHPGQLQGCIAPGMVPLPDMDGVGLSGEAMVALFGLAGGFRVGARGHLSVVEDGSDG